MHFSIYRPDGSIYQSNKVWHVDDATEQFESGLHDLGQRFVKTADAHIIPPDEYYVDVKVEELLERPRMPIDQSKEHMRAGADDFVLLRGIPTGSQFRILAGPVEYTSGEMDPDGTEIKLSVPVPCTCRVILDKWPYRTFTATIEVHA